MRARDFLAAAGLAWALVQSDWPAPVVAFGCAAIGVGLVCVGIERAVRRWA